MIPELSAVDIRSGLARVGGKMSVYLNILHGFAEGQADAPLRIRSALATGNQSTAEREIHTLKGVAGSIGASDLADIAKTVERLIKQGVDIEAPMIILERALSDLVQQISSLPREPNTVVRACPAEDPITLLPEFERLEALLDECDSEAIQLTSDLLAKMTDSQFEDPMRAIVKCIDVYDFDDAIALLQPLKVAIKSLGDK